MDWEESGLWDLVLVGWGSITPEKKDRIGQDGIV